MATSTAPRTLRPIADARPASLGGIRLFSNVVAHGDDLLKLGSLDGTKWVGCDLSSTVWPEVHNVELVDCDVRNTRWQGGENVTIKGTHTISVDVSNTPPNWVANDLDAIAARVDGMRVEGVCVGWCLERVANDAGAGITWRGQFHSGIIRRTYLPDADFTGLEGEDVALPRNTMPRFLADGVNLTRLDMAHTLQPRSSFVGARTLAINVQEGDLREVTAFGWKAQKGFFEHAKMRGILVDAETDFDGARMWDTKLDGPFGPTNGTIEYGPKARDGNARNSMRREVADQQADHLAL